MHEQGKHEQGNPEQRTQERGQYHLPLLAPKHTQTDTELHAGQADLMSIVVHGHPAALAHGEVDVRHRPVGHFRLFPLAAAQHP